MGGALGDGDHRAHLRHDRPPRFAGATITIGGTAYKIPSSSWTWGTR
jgi:hypothetical protein